MEMETGLIDAVLGGHLVKKRIATTGKGKSGSYRTIIAYRAHDRAFFIYGFAKNEMANVDDRELEALKKLARQYFGYDAIALNAALKQGALLEVARNE